MWEPNPSFKGEGRGQARQAQHSRAPRFLYPGHVGSCQRTPLYLLILRIRPFACHKPRSHQPTTIRQRLVASKTVYDVALLTRQTVDRTSIYGHTKYLFDDARLRMDAGTFKPVLDSATIEGIRGLSWWRGVAQ